MLMAKLSMEVWVSIGKLFNLELLHLSIQIFALEVNEVWGNNCYRYMKWSVKYTRQKDILDM